MATGITYAPMSNLVKSINHGNGLVTTAAYDLDYRLSSLQLKDGATSVSSLAYAYTDGINLTGITDQVTAANSNTLGYSPANRLSVANGPWGNSSIDYDARTPRKSCRLLRQGLASLKVARMAQGPSARGNRINLDTTLGGNTSTRLQNYAPNSNQQYNVYTNGALDRYYNYDGAGNIIADIRTGEWLDYTYNKRNRLSAVTRNSAAWATYGYNALEQLTTRVSTAPAAPLGQIAYTYDNDNHLLTEANAATGAKTRDYIWLPSNDNSPVDLPLGRG